MSVEPSITLSNAKSALNGRFPWNKKLLVARLAMAFLLLLFGYYLINHALVHSLIEALNFRAWQSAFVQSAIYTTSFIIFSINIVFLSGWIRLIILAAFSSSAVVNQVFHRIVGEKLDFDSSSWLFQETDQTGNILRSYTSDVLVACSYVAVGLIISTIAVALLGPVIARVISSRKTSYYASFGLLLLLSWNTLLFMAASKRQPNESSALAYAMADLIIPQPKGSGVTSAPSGKSPFEKVVLIVDESIRFDVYSMILSEEARRLNAIDFGEAISFSPCSAASNAMLRWGFTTDLLAPVNGDAREHPKIWRYAKKAGYLTHHLDGQSSGAAPSNFVGKDERRDIDSFQPMYAGMDTDKNLSKQINTLLRRHSRDFLFVNKNGAHFAYEVNYPAAWLPTIRTRSQSYAAAVRYSTSGFFDEMLAGVDMTKVLVLYTSDHGQRLDGTGSPHCNPNPKRGEHSVPLLAFTSNATWHADLAEASTKLREPANHLQIFPTLLASFGYDRSSNHAKYSPTLFDPPGPSYILGYPFKPFPNFRTRSLPVRTVTAITDIGPADNATDPPLELRTRTR